jgi:hypothetical protein
MDDVLYVTSFALCDITSRTLVEGNGVVKGSIAFAFKFQAVPKELDSLTACWTA